MNSGYIRNEEKLPVALHSMSSTTRTPHVAEKLPLRYGNKTYISSEKKYGCDARTGLRHIRTLHDLCSRSMVNVKVTAKYVRQSINIFQNIKKEIKNYYFRKSEGQGQLQRPTSN
jgi:hypothetical protein